MPRRAPRRSRGALRVVVLKVRKLEIGTRPVVVLAQRHHVAPFASEQRVVLLGDEFERIVAGPYFVGHAVRCRTALTGILTIQLPAEGHAVHQLGPPEGIPDQLAEGRT